MNKFQELLVAGLIAAVATGAVAGVVIWKTTATQHAFVAEQFAAQNAKVQTVGDELAKTAGDLKRLDGALKTTEATLREVRDQVALVGTRTGIAQINTLIEAANKTLGEIKQATAPEQAKTVLTPLGAKLDDANKALAALQAKFEDQSGDKTRDEALAQANAKLDDALKTLAAIGKTTDALKGNGTDTAKLDEVAASLTAIKDSLGVIKTQADADAAKLEAASKSIAALDTSVKQGFADVDSKQANVMKAVTKPAPAPPKPAEPKPDLVVVYVSMVGQVAAAPASSPPAPSKQEPGLTPVAPPPFAVRFERLGGVDDYGQTKAIADKVRALVKDHSGCTIAVSGHADTSGGDRKNYELSKRRANEVADELKAAFAGDNIKVDRTQWGERRLKEWTPDGIARDANRRVDVAVSCEK
jgi:outer membrane protein OmpA-like peptidoglycan-associated protein